MAARIPLPNPFDRAPFAYRSAVENGMSRGRLRGSDLVRPFHGTRHPGSAELGVDELCRAYCTVMRDDAFFCSTTAAVIMQVPIPLTLEGQRILHVAVPHPVRAPSGRGIVGHAVRLMGNDSQTWGDLRVSSPERLWCELSGVLTATQLVAAGDYLVHRTYPITSIERLADAAGRYPGRAGAGLRRECLPYLDPGAESPPESELRVVLLKAGITDFVANEWVRVPGGRFRGDLVCARRKMIIEYQGEYHFDLAQRRKDMTRLERLREAGWYVMQVNRDDLDDPRALVARIRTILASRPIF